VHRVTALHRAEVLLRQSITQVVCTNQSIAQSQVLHRVTVLHRAQEVLLWSHSVHKSAYTESDCTESEYCTNSHSFTILESGLFVLLVASDSAATHP
jgi:hypothetical protein